MNSIIVMIFGAYFGGMVTLILICNSLQQRIEKLERDVEKLIENSKED